MYRYMKVEVGAAYDSTLVYPVFGPLKVFCDQTKDLQVYSQVHRVNATDTEFTVPLGSVTTPYFLGIFSDYPVLIRLISNSTTQIQLRSNNVAATNVGSPLPDQCALVMTAQPPNGFLTLMPITGAAQTANVKVLCTGDPQNAYT